ncbi:hypothetical protein VF14_13685 [Nostoc linckia z18]|uniref:Uncharacterized protein n=2 Tax=Nostoc linckia TaxID=92942 RepID=A0A9Q5ZCG1_NOSLI|nr:hypothetical protein [Nostoc linckia]PHK42237.1 hypothetical protein VF12_03475 [Nostoc linckia z15]PHK45444.1 hypothetical protein VF13_15930 [Nostoc linckia z16]PHJ59021.1 hypothetical protein VF02_25910 [Nostoc linckia z1]PHJ61874.1 hypothetical protein VF05_27610 [Nostoc linckia z3]PHJ67791.1 hypothetical protein VF03_25360 [Nostoc linckia z2]
MNIEKGDKVKTPSGQPGEVIDYEYDRLFSGILDNPRMKVKLAGSGEIKTFSQNELTLLGKKPDLKQVLEALNNIKQQINSKNIVNLQKREKDELNTHVGYIEEYIQDQNKIKKDLAMSNLNFVEQTLKALSATSWAAIKDNLETIRWWDRYNQQTN